MAVVLDTGGFYFVTYSLDATCQLFFHTFSTIITSIYKIAESGIYQGFQNFSKPLHTHYSYASLIDDLHPISVSLVRVKIQRLGVIW